MNPAVLIYGLVAFIFSIVVHVAVWRLRRPRNRPLALAVVFFAVLPAPLGLLASFGPFHIDPAGWFAVVLLHTALAAAYILSYPAVEAMSPTLVVALMVGRSAEGVDREDIVRFFEECAVLEPRINDLLDSRFIARTGGGLTLTPAGRAVTAFFIAFRRVLGLPTGGG